MSRYQNVAYDKRTGTYEIEDEYGSTCLEKIEVQRLIRCVIKNTPDWLEELIK